MCRFLFLLLVAASTLINTQDALLSPGVAYTQDFNTLALTGTSTSEGILVFTSAAPPAAAVVGNLVQVMGTVTEFTSTGIQRCSPSPN